jgi:hypothetical protein
MPYPYAEARLLQLYGHLAAQLGELNDARRHLQEALSIFRQIEARRDIDGLTQWLSAL